jgi:hypothetical protein
MESIYCRGRIPKKYFTGGIAKIVYFAGGKTPFTLLNLFFLRIDIYVSKTPSLSHI